MCISLVLRVVNIFFITVLITYTILLIACWFPFHIFLLEHSFFGAPFLFIIKLILFIIFFPSIDREATHFCF